MKNNFGFKPSELYRVFRAKDYSFVKIMTLGTCSSVTYKRTFENKEDCEEYLKELTEYCAQSKIGVNVQVYGNN